MSQQRPLELSSSTAAAAGSGPPRRRSPDADRLSSWRRRRRSTSPGLSSAYRSDVRASSRYGGVQSRAPPERGSSTYSRYDADERSRDESRHYTTSPSSSSNYDSYVPGDTGRARGPRRPLPPSSRSSYSGSRTWNDYRPGSRSSERGRDDGRRDKSPSGSPPPYRSRADHYVRSRSNRSPSPYATTMLASSNEQAHTGLDGLHRPSPAVPTGPKSLASSSSYSRRFSEHSEANSYRPQQQHQQYNQSGRTPPVSERENGRKDGSSGDARDKRHGPVLVGPRNESVGPQVKEEETSEGISGAPFPIQHELAKPETNLTLQERRTLSPYRDTGSLLKHESGDATSVKEISLDTANGTGPEEVEQPTPSRKEGDSGEAIQSDGNSASATLAPSVAKHVEPRVPNVSATPGIDEDSAMAKHEEPGQDAILDADNSYAIQPGPPAAVAEVSEAEPAPKAPQAEQDENLRDIPERGSEEMETKPSIHKELTAESVRENDAETLNFATEAGSIAGNATIAMDKAQVEEVSKQSSPKEENKDKLTESTQQEDSIEATTPTDIAPDRSEISSAIIDKESEKDAKQNESGQLISRDEQEVVSSDFAQRYSFFVANEKENEGFMPRLCQYLVDHQKHLQQKTSDLKKQYKLLYVNWIEYVKELDRRKEIAEAETSQAVVDDTPPPASFGRTSRRGGVVGAGTGSFVHGDAVRSEAEFLEILANLERETAAENTAEHLKRTTATIPDMILDEDEKQSLFFDDRNRQVQDPLEHYHYWSGTVDSWTAEEHEIFKRKFTEYSKQFGKISRFIPNKTTSQCVLHYYLTKKEETYRSRLRDRGFRKRKKAATVNSTGAKPARVAIQRRKSKGSSLMTDIAAAKPVEEDEEEGSAVVNSGTSLGSPEHTDESAPLPKAADGKRRGISSGKSEKSVSGRPVKKQKQRSRSASPALRETESQAIEMEQKSVEMTEIPSSKSEADPDERSGKEMKHSKRPTKSSYWSLSETEQMRELLSRHGTNFPAIAQELKTKTATQVRNFYHKNISPSEAGSVSVSEQTRIEPKETSHVPPPMFLFEENVRETKMNPTTVEITTNVSMANDGGKGGSPVRGTAGPAIGYFEASVPYGGRPEYSPVLFTQPAGDTARRVDASAPDENGNIVQSEASYQANGRLPILLAALEQEWSSMEHTEGKKPAMSLSAPNTGAEEDSTKNLSAEPSVGLETEKAAPAGEKHPTEAPQIRHELSADQPPNDQSLTQLSTEKPQSEQSTSTA